MAADPGRIFSLLKTVYPLQLLDDSRLNRIASTLNTMVYRLGEVIYSEGRSAAGESLYIVLDGEVILYRQAGRKTRMVSVIKPGEMFGFEALLKNGKYRVSAAALKQVSILKLALVGQPGFTESFPELKIPFKILLESYQLALQPGKAVIEPDENVYFVSRRHAIHFLRKLIWPAIWAVVSLCIILYYLSGARQISSSALTFIGGDLLAVLAWVCWLYLDWVNDYSIVTDKRVIFKEVVHFLYESLQEAPMGAVLSTAVETTQAGRIFNYGDVVIRTFAGAVTLPMVRYPQQVRVLVDQLWSNSRNRQSQTDRQSIETAIRSKIGMAEPAPVEEKYALPPAEKAHPGMLQRALELAGRVFHMRDEDAGVIVYHTHWIFLIRGLWFQTLAISGLLTLATALVYGSYFGLAVTAGLSILGVLTLGAGAWWMYNFLDWQNDYYLISTDEVVDVYKKPLASEERAAAPLENISSIDFERTGMFGLLLNYGTVNIHVGDEKMTFNNVFDPARVQSELFRKIAENKEAEKQAAMDAEKERMVEYISAYHRVVDGQNGEKPDRDGEFETR